MSVVRRIAVGQNHRSAEVLNQPTDDILELSGCTLGATFPGFLKPSDLSSDQVGRSAGPAQTGEVGVTTEMYAVGDIRRYGAVVNSSSAGTANTTCIQNALDSLYALGGGVVLLPIGTWWTGQIKLRSNVRIVGLGRGSKLKAKNALHTHVVTLYDVNTEFSGLANLTISGNASQQIALSSDGVHLDNTSGVFTYSDPYHTFEDVFVEDTSNDGWFLTSGVRESRFVNCQAKICRGQGFEVNGTDNFFVGCTAATSYLNGWLIASGNNHFDACKSFSSGTGMSSTASPAAGFRIQFASRNQFTNCSAQDNGFEGWLFNGSTTTLNMLVGCTADSNGNTVNSVTGNAAGFRFTSSASKNTLKACFAGNQHGTQDYALQIASGSIQNRIEILPDSNRDSVLFPTASGGSYIGNELHLVPDAVEAVTFASTVTPDPYKGSTKTITLTGPITINAPLDADADSSAAGAYIYPGMTLRFLLTQDGTGGRVTTFAAAYKTNWTPTTTAGKVNSITFEYDGTIWIQCASVVGL